MTSFQSLALSCHFLFYGEQMCLPLWLTWAQWSEDAGKQEETEGIYKRAIFRLSGADSVPVKEKYLNWAYRSGGYKKARDVFKRYLQTCAAVTCLTTSTQTHALQTADLSHR